MNTEFSKYDRKCFRTTTIPITDLNDIVKAAGFDARVLTKDEDIKNDYKEYLAFANKNKKENPDYKIIQFYEYKTDRWKYKNLSVEINDERFQTMPSGAIFNKALGISIYNWKWNDSGDSVVLEYTV